MFKIFAFLGKLLVGGVSLQGGFFGVIISVVMFVWALSDIVMLADYVIRLFS